jgi:pyruvate dehydrogenase E2 component (dihydrolipoamide acetyltransferase)
LARALGVDLALVPRASDRLIEADVRAYADAMAAPQPETPATPVARRIAQAHQIDLQAVTGSGRAGRITKSDVQAQLSASTPQPLLDDAREFARFAGVRLITAARMAESAQTIPHVTLTAEADAMELVNARAQIGDVLGGKPSHNTLLMALVARGLAEFPALNAEYDPQGGLRLNTMINIGLAVDTERGLLVPVMRDVPAHTLERLDETLKSLIARAHDGKNHPADLEGGTFTISNLGMYGIDAFTPIIMPPQVAILGIGQIKPRVVPRNGEVVIRDMVALSLSFDHRAVDGGPAARFLARVKMLIERPYALLLSGGGK